MIHTISTKATQQQIKEMAEFYDGTYIKLAVDVAKKVLAGGGEWHADCEKVLLDQGSKQENVWGANFYPTLKQVDFYSLINIRPRQDNPGQEIVSAARRQKVEKIVRMLLEL